MFVVFEGIDGSGKSTQAAQLVKTLHSDLEKAALLTAEPTRSQLGSMIRGELVWGCDPDLERNYLDDYAMALLFQADRTYHLLGEIRPALSADIIVVCDRYVLSSMAYQTTDEQKMSVVHALNEHFDKPDITFYLDVSVSEAIRRMSTRAQAKEKFETETQLRRIRYRYDKAIDLVGDEHHVVRINAEQSPEIIASEILEHLSMKLINRIDQ